MWYVILGRDVEGSLEKRRAARPAHLQRLKALLQDGRLLVAGPMPAIDSPDPGPAGVSGSVIAGFPSSNHGSSLAATASSAAATLSPLLISLTSRRRARYRHTRADTAPLRPSRVYQWGQNCSSTRRT